MLLGFDATTIRGNKTGVGYYTARLLERLTGVGGDSNPIDEILVLSNRKLDLAPIPRCRLVEEGRFPSRALWMQAVLPLVLERIRPDLCHYTNFLGPYFTNTPYVVTFHDMTLELLPECHTWRKRLLTRALSPETARGARLIITPSQSAKRDLSRLLAIPEGKIRVIPHAPDPRFRPQRDRESVERIETRYGIRRPYVLYVGTLEPRKNLVRMLDAFSRVSSRYPDHSLYLAGELGWRSTELLQTLEATPNRDRISRLGYVAEEDLAALYSNADLFVYPSLYEGFGFPVVEAMACGVPVVTSNTSSLAEIAEGAALLVDPQDTESIAEAMDLAMGDEEVRERLRLAGLSRAASFSWERSTRETLEVYEEALERPSGQAPSRPETPVSDNREAQAVVNAVAYGAAFDYPMTVPEIHRSILAISLPVSEVKELLAHHPLVRENVEEEPPYCFLRGRKSSIESRQEGALRTRELLNREAFAIDLVRRTPFVRMVAFSGATAYESCHDGDIDLFVVTARERTWAAALLLFVAMKLLGRRKTICLNYFLSEDHLALPERDAFTASQIVSLKPLTGRSVFYRLVRANEWGASFFPNFWAGYRSFVPPRADEASSGSLLGELALSFGGGALLEQASRLVLGSYLRRQLRESRRASSVKLEPGVIKLHFKDHGRELNQKLGSLLELVPKRAGEAPLETSREAPDRHQLDAALAIDTPSSTREEGSDGFRFRCPECGSQAFSAGSDLLCPAEGRRLSGSKGVLPLMSAKSRAAKAPFLDTYRRIRKTEGWGGDADYYRTLPCPSFGPNRAVWKIRARSYRGALRAITSRFPGVEQADTGDRLALRVLEVGAGNGWFSWRMAQSGHSVLATDISVDDEDGLGALSRYSEPDAPHGNRLTRALAEMEQLPLDDAQFDVVVANGSLHYAGRIREAVREAHRVLRPGGLFLVLDSPVYDDPESGREMVRRRRDRHRQLGVADTASTEGFLVERDFTALSMDAGFQTTVAYPFEGARRRLRRAYCQLRSLAPPARFPVFALEKP